MTTITTKYETITIDDRIISDYRRLIEMPSTTEGLDGITIDSCMNNGFQTAKQHGLNETMNWFTFNEAAIYFTVQTARTYEIV